MTKKDFIVVAAIINRCIKSSEARQDYMAREGIREVARDLAYGFAGINPRFDSSKFYEACGLKAKDVPIC
jgi:hypothetical protein